MSKTSISKMMLLTLALWMAGCSAPVGTPTPRPPTAFPTLPAPTATLGPIVTLSAAQTLSATDFFAADPACLLPCWQGLTPGVSPAAAAPTFFAKLGIEVAPTLFEAEEGTYTALLTSYPATSPTVQVAWDNGVVYLVAVHWNAPPAAITLPQLQAHLGVPEMVMVSVFSEAEASVFFNYPQRQTAFFFFAKPKTAETGRTLCFAQPAVVTEVEVVLYNSFGATRVQNKWSEFWERWDVLLGMAPADLINLLQSPTECLPLP